MVETGGTKLLQDGSIHKDLALDLMKSQLSIEMRN